MSIIKKKSGLLMYQRKSAEYMEKLKTTPYPDWEYILLGDVTDIYDLTELAELSVAKATQMPKKDSKQLDGAHSCEGTTSAMNKKVLLLMALQKGLNIKFSAQNTANLTDTRLIAQEVWKLLNL